MKLARLESGRNPARMADFRPGWLISGARRPELACYQSDIHGMCSYVIRTTHMVCSPNLWLCPEPAQIGPVPGCYQSDNSRDVLVGYQTKPCGFAFEIMHSARSDWARAHMFQSENSRDRVTGVIAATTIRALSQPRPPKIFTKLY